MRENTSAIKRRELIKSKKSHDPSEMVASPQLRNKDEDDGEQNYYNNDNMIDGLSQMQKTDML